MDEDVSFEKLLEAMSNSQEGNYIRESSSIVHFRLKKKAILKDILENGVLGNTVAHIYTIEFQKRSLPHIYLLAACPRPTPRVLEVRSFISLYKRVTVITYL